MCWSHIERDFRRHSEGLSEQQIFGERGLELTRRVFHAWRAYQHEHHDRERLEGRDRADPDRTAAAARGRLARKASAPAGTAGSPTTCSRSGPHSGPSSTVEGVEATNNPAERALRGPVIHRKLSHGTTSTNGERFAERAQSAAATCRLQGRSLFAYLRDLLVAHSRGDPFPALT